MKSHPPDHEHGDHDHTSTSRLLRRLIQRLTNDTAKARDSDLTPSGQRTGSGSASVEAYLKEDRGSRPAPLE